MKTNTKTTTGRSLKKGSAARVQYSTVCTWRLHLPRRHVSFHVDVHAVEQTLHRVRRGEEEVRQVVARRANQQKLTQRLSHTSRPRR